MPRVLAVSLNPVRTFGKTPQDEIRLVADYGVEGDTHAGATLKTHNGMIEVNQRQVHLIASELCRKWRPGAMTSAPARSATMS